jgi:hypothetical protein
VMEYQRAFPALGSSAAWAGTDSETSSTGQGTRSASRLSAQLRADSAQPSQGGDDGAAQVFEEDASRLHQRLTPGLDRAFSPQL